ncbi:MAG: lipoprotein [Tatlockia sp.]|nr:lipoprotein [Tatlockia sp.]
MRFVLILLMLMTMWLVACGQKGPLYLPKPEQSTKSKTTQIDGQK